MATEVDGNNKLKLYSYWYSSCSCRVRISLNLKGLEYEYKAVDLSKGEQFTPEFIELNPISYVPVLVDGDVVLADSFSILMYLEERYPQHPLLPSDLKIKAINYQAANIVSSSIQPFQNRTRYIVEKFGQDKGLSWARYHIGKGFAALEMLLKEYAGKYATGDDVLLVNLFELSIDDALLTTKGVLGYTFEPFACKTLGYSTASGCDGCMIINIK